MNILDENISKNQRQLLESWRISIKQIGVNIGDSGMKDREIVSFLQQIRRPTFFTRAAFFIRRLLKHMEFNTQAKRMGNVVRVSDAGLACWRLHIRDENHLKWE